jgi:hypothetical protein
MCCYLQQSYGEPRVCCAKLTKFRLCKYFQKLGKASNPVVAALGLVFLAGGTYGTAGLITYALTSPIVKNSSPAICRVQTFQPPKAVIKLLLSFVSSSAYNAGRPKCCLKRVFKLLVTILSSCEGAVATTTHVVGFVRVTLTCSPMETHRDPSNIPHNPICAHDNVRPGGDSNYHLLDLLCRHR